jgi:hypothetical protein
MPIHAKEIIRKVSNQSNEWGTSTPDAAQRDRRFSDFEIAANKYKSKRKESNITEEVLEDDDEDLEEW